MCSPDEWSHIRCPTPISFEPALPTLLALALHGLWLLLVMHNKPKSVSIEVPRLSLAPDHFDPVCLKRFRENALKCCWRGRVGQRWWSIHFRSGDRQRSFVQQNVCRQFASFGAVENGIVDFGHQQQPLRELLLHFGLPSRRSSRRSSRKGDHRGCW
jgi:hypothetical protein